VAHKAEKESYEHQLAELRAEYAKTKEERHQLFVVDIIIEWFTRLGTRLLKNFFSNITALASFRIRPQHNFSGFVSGVNEKFKFKWASLLILL